MNRLGLAGLALIAALGCGERPTVITGRYEGFPAYLMLREDYFRLNICEYDQENKPKGSMYYNCVNIESSAGGKFIRVDSYMDPETPSNFPVERYLCLSKLLEIKEKLSKNN